MNRRERSYLTVTTAVFLASGWVAGSAGAEAPGVTDTK
jgi:hypothetical protein